MAALTGYTFQKDPNAVLDYKWDWSLWLQTAETIVSSSIIQSPGLTLNSQSNTATSVVAWISGGTVGNPYTVTCQITTSLGRTDDRTITIRCTSR